MRSSRTLTCIFSIYLITAACTSDETEQIHTFQIFEEEGVPVAITSGGPKYEGELFEYEEVVRLEQDESREETILFRASQYLMGEDDNYYVNDRGNVRIAVFGPDGKYLRSFGRDGDGPGAFRYPRLLWIRNDNVAVFDSRNRRTSLFHIDGSFIQTFSHLKGGSIAELHPTPEGCLVIIDSEATPFLENDYISRTYMATIVTAEGDTICQIKAPSFTTGRMILLEKYMIGITGQIYYGPRAAASYQPGKGILTYTTAEPEFKWYGLDGNLMYKVRIDMEPELVTREERQTIEQMLDRSIEAATEDRDIALAKAWKKYAEFPEIKSYWSTVRIDDKGYYWLGHHPDYSVEGMEIYRRPYRVLSPDGEYLGDTLLPERIFNLSRGHLLTFRENEETGESLFIVYRIIPAVEGLEYP